MSVFKGSLTFFIGIILHKGTSSSQFGDSSALWIASCELPLTALRNFSSISAKPPSSTSMLTFGLSLSPSANSWIICAYRKENWEIRVFKKRTKIKQWEQYHIEKKNEIVPIHPCFGSETTNLTHKIGVSPLTNWEIKHFRKKNYNQAMRTRAFLKKEWNSSRPPLSRIRDNPFNAQS